MSSSTAMYLAAHSYIPAHAMLRPNDGCLWLIKFLYNKKCYFCIFIKWTWLGVGYFNRSRKKYSSFLNSDSPESVFLATLQNRKSQMSSSAMLPSIGSLSQGLQGRRGSLRHCLPSDVTAVAQPVVWSGKPELAARRKTFPKIDCQRNFSTRDSH